MLDRGPAPLVPARRRAGRAGGARARAGAPDAGRAATCASLPTFTIDPVTAQDFDDAISAEALGDGALAHLGAHRRRQRVRAAGLAVDREAYRRATSVYVPGAVEPMLPEALSNDACSLVPGVRTASR